MIDLGGKPLAGFNDPIEMMKDCHRRIEHFLDVLRKVALQFGGAELTDEGRRALQASLNYFAHFAPRHSADEEQSLFPRLRLSDHAAAGEVMGELNDLERDHRRGDVLHTFIGELGHDWLETGHLDEVQRTRLRAVIDELAAMYAAHIGLEEQRVFPVALQILNSDQVHEIGQEMRARRSLAQAGNVLEDGTGRGH